MPSHLRSARSRRSQHRATAERPPPGMRRARVGCPPRREAACRLAAQGSGEWRLSCVAARDMGGGRGGGSTHLRACLRAGPRVKQLAHGLRVPAKGRLVERRPALLRRDETSEVKSLAWRRRLHARALTLSAASNSAPAATRSGTATARPYCAATCSGVIPAWRRVAWQVHASWISRHLQRTHMRPRRRVGAAPEKQADSATMSPLGCKV